MKKILATMNLEEKIAQELSKSIAEEIDFEILSSILDWHRVDLDSFRDRYHAVDINTWCHDNIKNEWKRNGRHFIFEDTGDAVNFTFRWR